MSDRKDKIKNIAIIFLSIMLVLTFFSNTIMNYSLVEVSTQYVYSGSITTKVRGSGTVEAAEGYSVMIKDTRKIETMKVKTGAEVEEGDVLFVLEESDSPDLETAKKSLKTAEDAYQVAVLDSGISLEQRANIEAGKVGTLNDRQKMLLDTQATIDAAQANYDAISAKIAQISDKTVDTSAEERAVLDASHELENAQAALTVAQDKLDDKYAELGITAGSTLTEEQKNALKPFNDSVTNAENAVNNAKAKLSNAQYALDVKKLDTSISSEKAQLQSQLDAANTELTNAKAYYDELKSIFNTEMELGAKYAEIQELKKNIAKLQSEAVDVEVKSPMAGTVTTINCYAGQTINPETVVMEIKPENEAYTLQFTVSAAQAKRIKAGDPAEVMYNWYGNDVNAKVQSVRKDPMNRDSYVVICEMSGDVSVGDSYTLSIGQQSSNYDYIVPTSCIREDSNGKFILIVEAKSTPLGNRYYARRRDVEVITSDDSQSAIVGALEGYEYVITTTTKPVEENQQVRLADE